MFVFEKQIKDIFLMNKIEVFLIVILFKEKNCSHKMYV